MKIGDLVIWPDVGVVLEEDMDELMGEKIWRVIFFDGDEEWFYEGYCEVMNESR